MHACVCVKKHAYHTIANETLSSSLIIYTYINTCRIPMWTIPGFKGSAKTCEKRCSFQTKLQVMAHLHQSMRMKLHIALRLWPGRWLHEPVGQRLGFNLSSGPASRPKDSMFLTNSTFAALQHPIHSPTPVLPTWWWPLRALGPIKVGHACKVKARKPWNCQVTVPRPLESDDKSFVQRPFWGAKQIAGLMLLLASFTANAPNCTW